MGNSVTWFDQCFQERRRSDSLSGIVVYYDCNWSNYYPSDNYPFMYKCRSANSSIIKYRYADVLLLKAEALIMQDTPIWKRQLRSSTKYVNVPDWANCLHPYVKTGMRWLPHCSTNVGWNWHSKDNAGLIWFVWIRWRGDERRICERFRSQVTGLRLW